jgi:hypothetical protein
MANTIDNRPTYFGDRMIITGTYTSGSGPETIDLSSLLSSIDFAAVTPTGTSSVALPEAGAGATLVTIEASDVATVSGTTLTITAAEAGPSVVGGTFFVIGRRS